VTALCGGAARQRAEAAVRLQKRWLTRSNEMKWRGEERKGNTRFSDPSYIRRLTDEYRWLVPVSHALPIFVGLAT
jgi:hypothetical protein